MTPCSAPPRPALLSPARGLVKGNYNIKKTCSHRQRKVLQRQHLADKKITMHAAPSGTWTRERCYFPLAARSRSGTRPSLALSQAPRRGGEARCNGTLPDGNISSHRRVHCHWQRPTVSTLAQPSSAKWMQSCSVNQLLNRSPFHSRNKGTKTLPSGTVLHRHRQ